MIHMIEEPPDTSRLYVPLRDAACGVSLRLFRDRGGERCAVGFTRLESMAELLGPDQQYYRLTARSVRELAGQRDVTRLIVDPVLVAAPVNDITPENKKLFIEVTKPVYQQFEGSIGKSFLDLAVKELG